MDMCARSASASLRFTVAPHAFFRLMMRLMGDHLSDMFMCDAKDLTPLSIKHMISLAHHVCVGPDYPSRIEGKAGL